jgi:hypothetical protein
LSAKKRLKDWLLDRCHFWEVLYGSIKIKNKHNLEIVWTSKASSETICRPPQASWDYHFIINFSNLIISRHSDTREEVHTAYGTLFNLLYPVWKLSGNMEEGWKKIQSLGNHCAKLVVSAVLLWRENCGGGDKIVFEKFHHYNTVLMVALSTIQYSTWRSVPDPGSGAFLPPGSGFRIRDEFFPDLGSRIQVVCFWWDFLKNPCSLIIFFSNKTCSWNYRYKKQEKSWFYFSSLFLCTVGSGIRCFYTPRIRDPDPGWSNGRIRIRDKPSRIRNTGYGIIS